MPVHSLRRVRLYAPYASTARLYAPSTDAALQPKGLGDTKSGHCLRSKGLVTTTNGVVPVKQMSTSFHSHMNIHLLHAISAHQPVTLLVSKRFTPNFVRLHQW